MYELVIDREQPAYGGSKAKMGRIEVYPKTEFVKEYSGVYPELPFYIVLSGFVIGTQIQCHRSSRCYIRLEVIPALRTILEQHRDIDISGGYFPIARTLLYKSWKV